MNIIKRITAILFIVTLIVYGAFRFIQFRRTDNTAPVITMTSDSIAISVKDTEEKLLDGIKAMDDRDGDISSQVIIEDISHFINDKRIITYVVADSHNNVSRATRELTYEDYTSPRFKVTSPLSYDNNISARDILKDIEAYDSVDGDISSNIKVNFKSPTEAGIYEAEFIVTNSSGDTVNLKMPIEIYSSGMTPQIYLKDYVIYTRVGEPIDPYAYLDTIGRNRNDSGENWVNYSDNIKVNDKSDSTKAGTYTITYEININGYKGSAFLIAVVED